MKPTILIRLTRTTAVGLALLAGTAAAELDLREANVTGVDLEERGGAHRFAVTLHHDDDGEAGYADRWQVATPDGRELGRRELAHPHGTRPFTRSAVIEVPAGVRYAVVRGHDQEHGFGGQAAVVELATGAVERIRQGSAPMDFGGYPDLGGDRGALGVRILGSGGPVLSNGRASAGYVFTVAGEPRLLMDAGGGTAARMGEAGVDAAAIDAYLLSHLHIDHTSDLPAILKSAYFQGRGEAPVAIVGPAGNDRFPGTGAWVAGLFDRDKDRGVYNYMHGFARKVAGGALNLDPRAVPADPADPTVRTVYEADGVTVKAVAVKHGPMPALAYRVEHGGRAVTFSGDLNGDSGNLVALAKGSDVLIHDAALSAKVPRDAIAAKLHAHPAEIGTAARKAGVDTLVLTHFMPPSEKRLAGVVERVAAEFGGTLLVARDNRLIRLAE